MTAKAKGRTTFRIAAILLLLSTLFELAGIFSPVPLLGVFRGGFAAAVYHLLYAALYLALAAGLWKARRWGVRLVFATALIYSLDKLQAVIYRDAILVDLVHRSGPYRQLLEAVDRQLLLQILTLVAVVFAACWWGFAVYAYFRRDYFRA